MTGPLEHHATIVARLQDDLAAARRGWALAYDDGSPDAGTIAAARRFARTRWGEAEAARLFEDASVDPDVVTVYLDTPSRTIAKEDFERIWLMGYEASRSRLSYCERRLAALRGEKKRAMQRWHGYVLCEACRSIIDTSIGEVGRDYLCDDDGCYLCRGCWPPSMHKLIDDTTAAIHDAVGDFVPYSEDNVGRVQAAIGGVLEKAIADGTIGSAIDVTVTPRDAERREVDVEVTVDRLRILGGRPTLAEDALRVLVDVAQDLAGMRSGLGDEGPVMPLEEDCPGATAAINRARAVLGLGAWP